MGREVVTNAHTDTRQHAQMYTHTHTHTHVHAQQRNINSKGAHKESQHEQKGNTEQAARSLYSRCVRPASVHQRTMN